MADAKTVAQKIEAQPPLPEFNESISNFQIFHTLLSPLTPGKMLDLGTGAGTFSLMAARLGWEVTAVDARTVRMPNPDKEKNSDRVELTRSIRWVQSDVRDFPILKGDYDLICIFGILHHLELGAQIELLRRCSHTLTILTVRVVAGAVTTEGRYDGINYREPGETREERSRVPSASWGNEFSFYHTEDSLLRLLQDSGYTHTMVVRPAFERNYTFYVGLPAPLSKQALKLEDLTADVDEIRYHYELSHDGSQWAHWLDQELDERAKSSLHKELEQHVKQLDTLQKKIRAMEHSTSWRVTFPLRRLRNWVRAHY